MIAEFVLVRARVAYLGMNTHFLIIRPLYSLIHLYSNQLPILLISLKELFNSFKCKEANAVECC